MKLLFPSRLRTLLSVLVLLGCLTAALPAHASPLYLLNQRAGQQFTYESRSSTLSTYDAMLSDATYNYPYAFTEGMNTMLRNILGNHTVQVSGYTIPKTFATCKVDTTSGSLRMIYAAAGCYKSLLHAGVAGDCVAANPLCCVLYWRYPASLSDRLPLRDIDPQLIFWDGTQAVNGFFTNFSQDYLAEFQSCTALPTWPMGNLGTAGVALSVDASGEWRFTRRVQPALSLVEHRITAANSTQAAEFAALDAVGTPVWKKQHRFGDLTIVAPIVACAGLLVVCLVLLLLFYLCTVPPAQKTQAELQSLIDALETSTAEQEAEISRRRTRSERRTSQPTSGRQTPNGSFARSAKTSPSPVEFHRSLSSAGPQLSQLHLIDPRGAALMGMSPSLSPLPGKVFTASPASRSPPSVAGPAALSRHGSQSPSQLQPASSGRRASITADHRRPAKQQTSPAQQLPRTSSNLSHNSGFAGGLPSRPLSRTNSARSRTSSVPLSQKHSAQVFQNPLLGRQSFKQ